MQPWAEPASAVAPAAAATTMISRRDAAVWSEGECEPGKLLMELSPGMLLAKGTGRVALPVWAAATSGSDRVNALSTCQERRRDAAFCVDRPRSASSALIRRRAVLAAAGPVPGEVEALVAGRQREARRQYRGERCRLGTAAQQISDLHLASHLAVAAPLRSLRSARSTRPPCAGRNCAGSGRRSRYSRRTPDGRW